LEESRLMDTDAPRPPGPAAPTPLATAATHAPSVAGSLSGALRAVSGMTFLSRLFGLVRDVLLVRIFGDSAIGSAFSAAFTIPNTFRRLFGEGALSAAFIPEYTQAHKSDPARAGSLASLTILVLTIVTSALCLLIQLALVAVIIFAPHDADRSLSLWLTIAMLPFMPLVCIAAILAGMLQVHGRFAASAAGPVVLNAFIIAVGMHAILTGTKGGPITAFALAGATVLSGLTQVLWFRKLLRANVTWTRAFAPAREAAARMFRKFIPVVIGMGTLQINTFLDMLITMWPIWVGPTVMGLTYPMDDASASILAFTQRLYQFPLGVFGIAVATAAFPLLARHADEPGKFADVIRRGLRLSLFIGLPASLGLIAVRTDLTTTLFGGGSADTGFSAAGLERSAFVLLAYAPGVWAYSINHVLTRSFYARGDTATPMRVSIAMVFINLLLNLSLIWSMKEAGLALATSLTAMLQCLILGVILRSRLRSDPRAAAADAARENLHLLDGPTARAMIRTAIASAIMFAGVLLLLHFWSSIFPAALAPHTPERWRDHAFRLICATAVGAALFAGASLALRLPELRWLLSPRSAR
jgi:putative peptidoglycan lipid II flippase